MGQARRLEKRLAKEDEVKEARLFLLTFPPCLTGEILYLASGRHLI